MGVGANRGCKMEARLVRMRARSMTRAHARLHKRIQQDLQCAAKRQQPVLMLCTRWNSRRRRRRLGTLLLLSGECAVAPTAERDLKEPRGTGTGTVLHGASPRAPVALTLLCSALRCSLFLSSPNRPHGHNSKRGRRTALAVHYRYTSPHGTTARCSVGGNGRRRTHSTVSCMPSSTSTHMG